MDYGGMAGAAVGGIFGLATSALNNYYAEQREEEARQHNYILNEQAAWEADRRTRALYADLQSPEALRKQYEEAGLSPSVMFGAGGTSGATPSNGAQGAGPNGIAPNVYGVSALEAAQIGLMTAQAQKLEAETETEKGENDRGKAEIDNIVAQTANTELKNVWQEYSNTLAMLEVQVKATIADTIVENYVQQTEKLKAEARKAKVDAKISEATEQTIIDYTHEKTSNLIADTIVKETQGKLNKTQAKDLLNQIENRNKNTELRDSELKAQVEQWAEQNNLTEKKIIVDGAIGGINAVGKLYDIFLGRTPKAVNPTK